MPVIRPATPADAADVAVLARALNEHQGDPTEHFDVTGFVRHGVGDGRAFETLVADDGGRVVGYALFHDAWDTAHAVRGLYLCDLFVQPPSRRRGVGRRLLAAVVRAARDRGSSFVWWTAKPTNTGALAFYRQLSALSEPVVAHALAFEAFDRLANEADPVREP